MRVSGWSSDVCSSDLPCRLDTLRSGQALIVEAIEHRLQFSRGYGKANMDQPAIEELVVGRALFVEDREDLAILQPLADGVEFGGEVGSVHGPSYRAPPLAPRRSRIEIGGAAWRESGCQRGEISVV